MRSDIYAILAIALLSTVLVHCSSQPDEAKKSAKAEINDVSFTAFEYGFSGPENVPAGMTRVRIINKGQALHHIQLVRLTDNKTAADFVTAMKANPSHTPAWAKMAGGPNAIVPLEEGTATVHLEEGQYVLVCLIPDQKGVPHVAKGMLKPLTVTAATGPPAAEPPANVTIAMSDHAYALSAPLSPGTHTLRVENRGMQPHEVVVVRLAPGTTIKDFAAAFEPGASGPPPGKPVGGIVGLEKGRHGFFTTTLAPGHYGLICFFPDAEKSTPHFAMGMTTEFNVK